MFYFLHQLKTFYQTTTEAFVFTIFVNRELAIVLN